MAYKNIYIIGSYWAYNKLYFILYSRCLIYILCADDVELMVELTLRLRQLTASFFTELSTMVNL